MELCRSVRCAAISGDDHSIYKVAKERNERWNCLLGGNRFRLRQIVQFSTLVSMWTQQIVVLGGAAYYGLWLGAGMTADYADGTDGRRGGTAGTKEGEEVGMVGRLCQNRHV